MTASAEFHKQHDGSVVLKVVRHDGSSTSLASVDPQEPSAVRRQLAGWAVERGLRLRKGRYGLVAGGVDLATLAAPPTDGVRSSDEMVVVEVVLELLDSMRLGQLQLTIGEIDSLVDQACRRRGVRTPVHCSGARVRDLLVAADELWTTWARVPIGAVLRLPIDW